MDEKIMETAKQNGNLITTAQVRTIGLSNTMLSKYVDSGSLIRVSHGVYALPDSVIDDMYVLNLRSQKIVFSHESALFLNGISDRTPFSATVTIPSNAAVSADIKSECTCFSVLMILRLCMNLDLKNERRHSEILSAAIMQKEQSVTFCGAVPAWMKRLLFPL